MSKSFYHKEVTDAQWNRIKSLFPARQKIGRPSLNPRIVFNGILWILKSGARWRDLPARYGNWNSIYHKFRQWSKCGLFARLLNFINAVQRAQLCLNLILPFAKCIKVPAQNRKIKQ